MNGFDFTRIEAAINSANSSALRKADTINISTNLISYDLEQYAKGLYYNGFPMIKRTPRKVSKNGSTAVHWKSITGVNTSGLTLGVSEGNRNANMAIQEVDSMATYSTLGLEADLTFEAEEAAESFDDARAIRTNSLLNGFFIGEEKVLLFGNKTSTNGTALGTPSTPTVTGSTTSGTLPAATYYVRVVALTYQGLQFASVANGVATTISRTNADQSTDTISGGSSNVSAASSSVTLASVGTVTATVTPVAGAFGYAWFIGTSATGTLAAITSQSTIAISAAAAGTQVSTAITADNSLDPLVYDGLIPQAIKGGAATYNFANAGFTTDGAGGCNELDVMLENLYNNYKLGVHHILLNANDHKQLSNIVIANGGAPLVRYVGDFGSKDRMNFVGGQLLGEYVNKFTGELISLETHPYMPQGTFYGYATKLPYTVAHVPVTFQLQLRGHDYWEIEWPLVTRRRQHGIYVSPVLKYYAPFAALVGTNLKSA